MELLAAPAAPPRTVDTSWDADDVVRYHVALGAGGAIDDDELRYVDEEQVFPLPTFAAVVAGEASTPLVYGEPLRLDPDRVLHVAQSVDVQRPMPPTAAGYTQSALVESVWDEGRSATVVVRVDTTDPDGLLACTSRFTLRVRGAGGFGGSPGPQSSIGLPDGDPVAVVDVPTLRQQALMYRACADRHRIHLDPAVARAAGFERPLLQGLCTWGIACKVLVDELLHGDASAIGSYSAGFAGPVYPGETLRVRAWLRDGSCQFTADVVERDAPALRDGHLTVTQPDTTSPPARRGSAGG